MMGLGLISMLISFFIALVFSHAMLRFSLGIGAQLIYRLQMRPSNILICAFSSEHLTPPPLKRSVSQSMYALLPVCVLLHLFQHNIVVQPYCWLRIALN